MCTARGDCGTFLHLSRLFWLQLSEFISPTIPMAPRSDWLQALAAVHAALRRAAVDAAPHPLAAPTRAISAAARASCWTVALGLVELLRAVHLRADAYVFGAALSATERAAQWSWAVSLLAGLGEINEVLLSWTVGYDGVHAHSTRTPLFLYMHIYI